MADVRVGSHWCLKTDDITTAWIVQNNYVDEFAPFNEVVIVMSNDVSVTFSPVSPPPGWKEDDEDFLFTGNFLRIYEEKS